MEGWWEGKRAEIQGEGKNTKGKVGTKGEGEKKKRDIEGTEDSEAWLKHESRFYAICIFSGLLTSLNYQRDLRYGFSAKEPDFEPKMNPGAEVDQTS